MTVESTPADDVAARDVPPAPTGDAAAPRGRERMRQIARLLLAPVLATAAVGVHWLVNVPPGGAKVSARDQGAEKPGAKADKKKKKKPPKKKGFEARPPGEVEATFLKYEAVEFETEPVKSSWARPHQTLVNQAVAKARSAAFEGAPEEPRVSVDDVSCRTVRCRFVLRGQFPHEVDLLGETLSRMQLDGTTIWRHYTSEKIAPPKPDQPKDDTYLQVTVAFMEDNMDNARFEVPADEVGGAGDSDDGGKPADDEDEAEEANSAG